MSLTAAVHALNFSETMVETQFARFQNASSFILMLITKGAMITFMSAHNVV